MISALIGVLVIFVVGAICFWAIDKFANDRRLANLLKLLVILPRRDPAARAAACRNLLLGRFAAGPFEQACAAPPQNAARLYPATALLQVGHNLVSPSS